MRHLRLILPLLLCTSVATRSVGQNGSIDLSFNPQDQGYGIGDGCGSAPMGDHGVEDMLGLPGGGYMAAGGLGYGGDLSGILAIGTACDQAGTRTNYLNAGDGVLRTAVRQVDGRFLFGGVFGPYFESSSTHEVRRLNADGTLDITYNPNSAFIFNDAVNCIAMKQDGTFIVGGAFTTYGPYTKFRILRLNSNGSLGNQFLANLNGEVHALAVEPSGLVIAAGAFTQFDGSNRIVRFDQIANSTDATWNMAGTGPNGVVRAIALQPDGKILMAGDFTDVNGTPRNRIARLNVNGSVDTGFDPGSGCNGSVRRIQLRSDGKVDLIGDFTQVNGSTKAGMARLFAHGALDTSFDIGTGPDDTIRDVTYDGAGRLVVGGLFRYWNGIPCTYMMRLLANGAPDPSYVNNAANYPVTAVLPLANGGALIGGVFNRYNGEERVGLARLLRDGSVDPTFSSALRLINLTNVGPVTMRQRPDGKYLIGGSFRADQSTRYNLVLLNTDGTWDQTFQSHFTSDWGENVKDLVVLPDNRALVCGSFIWPSLKKVVRLLADGTADPSFTTQVAQNGDILCMAVQPDGRVLIAGDFTLLQGTGTVLGRIARLMPDGTFDPSFIPGSGFDQEVEHIALRPDGRIVVSGRFTNYQGTPRARVAQLLPDGSLDTSFDTGSNGLWGPIAIAADGSLLNGGSIPGVPSTAGIRRFSEQGTLDLSYQNGHAPANSTIKAMALDVDRLYVGGWFTELSGIGRNRITRVNTGNNVSVFVSVKAWLEGPWNNVTLRMNDFQRSLGTIPLQEPYTALGYGFVNSTAGATIAPSVLTTTGTTAIVDWVVLELRSEGSPGTIASSRAALIRSDGQVVDLDGGSLVEMRVPPGNYHVALRHRNHLGAMTATALPLSHVNTTIDLTSTTTLTYGTNARKNVGGRMMLWAGDVNFNGQLKYAGSNNDRDPILVRIGGTVPTAIATGYRQEDVNLNGQVKYAGVSNDRDPQLVNIGGTVPTAVRTAQLP
ncbi:MAG: delta-60 repeat domain-containing protein [Flavobacteriales bacterium]|nr:delta-60 repeat domain-containing protein [Flavobacteriales bacterium]